MNLLARASACFLAVSATLLLPVSPAVAADASGKFAVRGIGSARCDSVVEAFAKRDEAKVEALASWLMGYATSYNRLVAQNYDAMPTRDGRDIIAVVLGLCKGNPSATLETASYRALISFAALRIKADSPMVNFVSDGKSMELHLETVKLVQTRLKGLKLYGGAENGEFNPQIVAAIKTFQANNKMPVTGLPDLAFLARLIDKK